MLRESEAKNPDSQCYPGGGRGGIRTHGEFNPTLDFESSAFNRTQPPFLFPALVLQPEQQSALSNQRANLQSPLLGAHPEFVILSKRSEVEGSRGSYLKGLQRGTSTSLEVTGRERQVCSAVRRSP